MKLTQTGVGTVSNSASLRDIQGGGLMPCQVEVDAGITAVSFSIKGRVSPDAPWREIRAPASAGFLEAIAFVPFVQLNVISQTGNGSVNLWIAEG